MNRPTVVNVANLSVTFYSLLVVGLVSELTHKTGITYPVLANSQEGKERAAFQSWLVVRPYKIGLM